MVNQCTYVSASKTGRKNCHNCIFKGTEKQIIKKGELLVGPFRSSKKIKYFHPECALKCITINPPIGKTCKEAIEGVFFNCKNVFLFFFCFFFCFFFFASFFWHTCKSGTSCVQFFTWHNDTPTRAGKNQKNFE